jgi:hypothetical protein
MSVRAYDELTTEQCLAVSANSAEADAQTHTQPLSRPSCLAQGLRLKAV